MSNHLLGILVSPLICLFKMPTMVVISESFLPRFPLGSDPTIFPSVGSKTIIVPLSRAGRNSSSATSSFPHAWGDSGQKHIFKWGLGWTLFPFELNPESILLPRLLSWPAADLDTFPSSCGSNVTRRGTHRTTWSPDSWASPLMYIYQYIT